MSKTGIVSALALAAALVPTWAVAQPGAAPAPPPPAPVQPPYAEGAQPPSGVPEGSRADAHSGTVFISPTALMAPAGTITLQSTQLIGIGIGFAASDNVSLSAHTLIPIDPDDFQPFFLTAKYGTQLSERFHLGIQGVAAGLLGYDEGGIGTLVGGIATYCLDAGCNSIVNGFLAGAFAITDGFDQTAVPLVFSAGWVQRLGGKVKLVVELDSAGVIGEINDVAAGLLAWYGIRISGDTLGVNLGLVKPLCDGCDTDVFPAGFPWLTVVFRAN